ncbi:MAG: aminotransferase class III-fold pyridoxal phosphate-dependent enzyme [Pseudomonadota bacterium]|nr:aminotransferase class III-fold pyridoxal phosphate-dependent enzyme [Pseudomonadota bacterium]
MEPIRLNAQESSPAAGDWATLFERNLRFLPGGVSSMNRIIEPALMFTRGQGAHIWDVQGRRYVDYHAGFAPHFLGHNFAATNRAVIAVLQSGESLIGAGLSALEGELAELVCANIAAAEKVTLLNTGSEATSLAIRLSRAITKRSDFIVMQGGYNGNHDELACNVFNTVAEIGPRVSPGEYPLRPVGAGTILEYNQHVHAINFNDLESVRYACQRHPIAALITEPVLQNIGVVKPEPGYLEGLRALADEFGFILIFDEIKTGFRHALGGYSEISGVLPDLVAYGKAVANGFPLAILGGKRECIDYIVHEDVSRRPFVAGTYNGHPVGVAAGIATVRHLIEHREAIYPRIEKLGRRLEAGLAAAFERRGIEAIISRQGSALSFYFMRDTPRDLHDIIEHHDFERDVRLRRSLVERGVFFVPIATKQCSISAAHTEDDIDFTIERFDEALKSLA